MIRLNHGVDCSREQRLNGDVGLNEWWISASPCWTNRFYDWNCPSFGLVASLSLRFGISSHRPQPLFYADVDWEYQFDTKNDVGA